MTKAPWQLTATELAADVASGRLRARDAVDACIARSEAVNGALNALVFPTFERARAEADAADRAQAAGAPLGPLHGVPVTIKEHLAVAGTPATFGVAAVDAAEHDGPLVARLRAAGAIVIGKTNVPQLLIYNETDNPVYGRSNNPWDPARATGGSSGGEAALIAACGSPLGLGSDIGGSLRTPAHACGVTSFKPTSGRLTNEDAREGGFAHGQNAIVSQSGPLARSVADCALAMRVLAAAGQTAFDAGVAPVPWPEHDAVDIAALRIGYYEDDGFFPSSPALRRAVREAVATLAARGAQVVAFAPPDVRDALATYYGILSADGGRSAKVRLGGAARDRRISGLLQLATLPSFARRLLSASLRVTGQRRLAQLAGWIRPRDAAGYWELVEAQAAYRRRFVAALDAARIDALVCPPHALPALTHGASYELTTASSYAMFYNLLGMPAGVVPVTRVREGEATPRRGGRDPVTRRAAEVERGSAGLPVGVQVVARHWREDIALAVMAAVETDVRNGPEYPRLPPREEPPPHG